MQMPTNSFNKRWVECCHCCSTRHYVYTVQRSAGCCRPLSSHWSPQWASNSGSLNWQQQLWRGSGEAGRLGGTGDGDTMAMDGGPGHTDTIHHTRAGAYLRGAAISLSVHLHICSCLLCLKCTEFVILCLYNSTNRVYIIHQIKSK